MTDGRHGRRGRHVALASAALLVLAGAVALGVGLAGQEEPPQPPATTGTAMPTTGTAMPTTGTAMPTTGAPSSSGVTLPASEPTLLEIPAIGVRSPLLSLGLDPDGSVEVPPLEADSRAGWYRGSPTPGERGPALLLGHVDSAEYGPGVFFRLGGLRPGDAVQVTRADGTVAGFTVDRVESYPKDDFPTLAVFGNTDRAELRLITCGGDFDAGARSYTDNVVVYASLTAPPARPEEP